MHIVKLEALYWCKTAVPIGVIVGIVGTWMLCALLRFGAGAEFVQIPLFGISSVGIISGIVVGVLTVLLSSISRKAGGRCFSGCGCYRKSFRKLEHIPANQAELFEN